MRVCQWAAAFLAGIVICGCGDDDIPTELSSEEYSQVETRRFAVSDSSLLVAETFVGAITVSQAMGDSLRVTATKQAKLEADLTQVHVEMTQEAGEVRVIATNPSSLDQVSVDIEATVPPGTRVDLATGVGSVDCAGRPAGVWDVVTGVGKIELALPDDVDVNVDLVAGVGQVEVAFPVDGEVTAHRVVGTIGAASADTIVAHVGVGSIYVVRQ